MAYLTYDEFKKLNPLSPLADDENGKNEFEKWLVYASDQIDQVTNHFYDGFSLDSDSWTFRAHQFKKAVAIQTGELYRMQTLTSSESQDRPQAITIGRTTVTNRSGASTSGNGSATTAVVSDARDVLIPTGLLYRGGGYHDRH